MIHDYYLFFSFLGVALTCFQGCFLLGLIFLWHSIFSPLLLSSGLSTLSVLYFSNVDSSFSKCDGPIYAAKIELSHLSARYDLRLKSSRESSSHNLDELTSESEPS